MEDTRVGHPPAVTQRVGQPAQPARFYDFVVRSEKKKIEKLRYIHRNPVKRGLVSSPELWRWSSFRFYRFGEPGPVFIDQAARAEMKVRPVSQKA